MSTAISAKCLEEEVSKMVDLRSAQIGDAFEDGSLRVWTYNKAFKFGAYSHMLTRKNSTRLFMHDGRCDNKHYDLVRKYEQAI